MLAAENERDDVIKNSLVAFLFQKIDGFAAGQAGTLEELRKLVFEGIPFFLGEPAEIIEIFEEPGQVISELSSA